MKNTIYRNDGNSDDYIIQNKFTAYLTSALMGHKSRYLEKQATIDKHEFLTAEDETYFMGNGFESEIEQIHTFTDAMFMIENNNLRQFLTGLKERQFKILILRVIFELPFSQIAFIMNEKESKVKNCYYYIINRHEKEERG